MTGLDAVAAIVTMQDCQIANDWGFLGHSLPIHIFLEKGVGQTGS